MKIKMQQLKCEFRKIVCMGLTLFIFVVMGAGCAARHRHHRQDRGPYIKIEGGEDSGGVTWSK